MTLPNKIITDVFRKFTNMHNFPVRLWNGDCSNRAKLLGATLEIGP